MSHASVSVPAPPAPVPRLVRALDAAWLVALALAIVVLVFGGVRVRYDIVGVSIQSPWRALLAAVGLAGVRHLLLRRPTTWDRLRTGWTAWRQDVALREAVGATLAIRLPVLAAGFLAVLVLGYPPSHRPSFLSSPNEFVNLPNRWDAGWYLGIAIGGYEYDPQQQGQQNIAFFPAYPMLTRTVAALLGARQTVVPGSVNRRISG